MTPARPVLAYSVCLCLVYVPTVTTPHDFCTKNATPILLLM